MRITNNKVTSIGKIKVHNVDILDGSGSMGGAKYSSAKEGIALDLQTCKEQEFETFTFVEFNNGDSITTHCFMSPLNNVELYFRGAEGGTPLYRTIGETLERLLKEVPEEDKVLVKIFTDGEENASVGKYNNPKVLKDLIESCEKRGFTITFIGTENDTNFIVKNLNIDKTNTLVHDNTGQGVEIAFLAQASATVQYRKSLDEGADVSRGFYTKTLTNQ